MKEKWMARIKEHYDHSLRYVLNENQIFGVFLVGSQNYGLATSDSDVDTRVIILPSVNEIATNAKPVSKQVIFEDEHLTLTDFRLWFQQLRKGDPSIVETLFTDYFIINPLYAEVWEDIVEAREDISRFDEKATCHAIKGVFFNKKKYCFKKTEEKKEVFEKFGYNPKCLMTMLRLHNLLVRFTVQEESLSTALKLDEHRNYLLDVKNGHHSLDEAKVLAEHYEERLTFLVNALDETIEKYSEVEKYYDTWHRMDKIAEKAFKLKLRGEVND